MVMTLRSSTAPQPVASVLFELLALIGIIAVLVGTLLPASDNAERKANEAITRAGLVLAELNSHRIPDRRNFD